jgi:exosortase family protein XrtM
MKKMLRTMKRFVSANRRELRFVFFFVIIFIIAQSLYYFSDSLGIPDKFQHSNAAVSASIVNLLSPGEKITVTERSLKSDHAFITIAWGCEGIEGIFLIIAGLVAYSMALRRKLLGILIGIFFMYFLNILRIIILYYTASRKPALFDFMHIYIGQTFIIFFGVLFFVGWILFCSSPQIPQNE